MEMDISRDSTVRETRPWGPGAVQSVAQGIETGDAATASEASKSMLKSKWVVNTTSLWQLWHIITNLVALQGSLFSHSSGGEKSRCGQGPFPTKALRRILLCFFSFCWLPLSFTCGCIIPVSASVCTWPSPLRLNLPLPLSYKDNCHWIYGLSG